MRELSLVTRGEGRLMFCDGGGETGDILLWWRARRGGASRSGCAYFVRICCLPICQTYSTV